MGEEQQKKVFFKTIGGNEETFLQERTIEADIFHSILECPKDKRDEKYREGYEKLHNFFISVAGIEHLYKGASLHGALWKQTLVGRIVGTDKNVLEVGCGEGFLSIALSRQGNKVTGVDVSDTCIVLANKNKKRFKGTNVNFSRMNATKMDFQPSTFDWIVSMDLIEHLHPEDALNHLLEAANLLKANGKYLLMTPNSETGSHAGGVHIKEYTLKELELLFSKAGFSIKSTLLNIVSPLNILVNPQIKIKLGKLTKNQLINLILGLDPIILIATKN